MINFYAIFNNIEKKSIKKALEKNGWNSRKASWTDFELSNTWSELILEGDDDNPLLNGTIEFIPENIMVLDKIFNDLKGEYEYEFYDEDKKLISQTKSGG